jgi:hypothetical protein
MIRHTVVLRLKHPAGSSAEREFIAAAQSLRSIPGVGKFEVLRQVGRKNSFTFGISMEFADAATYARYNEHPDHKRFVQERWLKDVQEFLEIDYVPYSSRD